MIGICTTYRHHDATLAALSLAKTLDELGLKYVFNNIDWRAATVDRHFDNKVRHNRFHKWIKPLSHIFWFDTVDGHFLEWAAGTGITNILYTSWERIHPYDEYVLPLFDKVMLPTASQVVRVMNAFNLMRVTLAPYCCHYPISRRGKRDLSNGIHIMLTTYGTQGRRVDLSALLTVGAITAAYDNVVATFICPGTLSAHTRMSLDVMKKRVGDRLNIIRKATWNDHACMLTACDLAVWLPRIDGFGVLPTTALHMGVPVVSWDAIPMREVVIPGRNALLVNCEVENNWFGVDEVVTDYGALEADLAHLIENPAVIQMMQANTHHDLAGKDAEFKQAIISVLSN